MPANFNDSGLIDTKKRASRGEIRLAAGMSVVVILLFVFMPTLTGKNCPPDAILSGHMGRGHTYFLYLLIFGALLLALWMATRPPAFDLVHRLMGIVPVAMLGAGVGLWLQASFSFYCATPDIIHLYPVFARDRDVGWSDVWHVVPQCESSRPNRGSIQWGGLTLSIDLLFSSGDAVHVTGSNTTLPQKYTTIVQLLRDKPAKYELSEVANCPAWRSFFYEQLR